MATPIPSEELHETLASYHWDLYKEIHGIRPRWYRYSEMTVSELEAAVLALEEWGEEIAPEWDSLDACIKAEEEAEAAEAARAHEERWMDAAAAVGALGW